MMHPEIRRAMDAGYKGVESIVGKVPFDQWRPWGSPPPEENTEDTALIFDDPHLVFVKVENGKPVMPAGPFANNQKWPLWRE